MPLSPRSQHLLDQFQAYFTEVQSRLKSVEADLLEMGYSKGEAWEITRDLEERLLGPAMAHTEMALKVDEEVERVIAEKLEGLEEDD